MNVSAQVPDNDPLMIAWKAYKATSEYSSSLRWARTFVIGTTGDDPASLAATHPHTEGSLWGAFVAGFTACSAQGKSEVQK